MNSAAPNTDREYAYLSITGYGDHKEISQALELEPSRAWNIGEDRPRGGKYTCTKWRLDSGLKDTESMDKHIDALLVGLESRREALRKLYPDWTASIQCVGYYPSSQHGHHLSKENIQTAAHLGLEFDFDLYFVGEDEHG